LRRWSTRVGQGAEQARAFAGVEVAPDFVAVGKLLEGAPASFVSDREAELESALAAAEIPSNVELTTEQATITEALSVEILFQDVRAFMRVTAQPSAAMIQLVVVDEILPRSMLARFPSLEHTTGLGFSPSLIAAMAEASEPEYIESILGVRGDFTPTAFVAREAIARTEQRADEPVAHEVGHALGLPHSMEFGNLMLPMNDYGTCRPILTDLQVQSLTAPHLDGFAAIVPKPRRYRELVISNAVERFVQPRLLPAPHL